MLAAMPGEAPDSTPNFQGGRYRGLIVAAVVVVVAVVAVLALSGMFTPKKSREYVLPEENVDNKEGGCPCSCDRSEAMAAELRTLGGDAARIGIADSLATIAEREAAGYITEAMVAHRLRLLGVDRELSGASTFAAPQAVELSQPLRRIDGGRLLARMELWVHGATTEWVRGREKPLRASFVLAIELENRTDARRSVKPPVIEASAPYPISRWYVRGESGQPWDGELAARERKVVFAIGYVGEELRPKTRIQATVRFESAAFQLATRARARWNDLEPTLSLRVAAQ